MNLTHLEYFLKVAESGHVTRAAEELHITQPALSRALAALESDLGVSLFERDRRKLILNENGQIVLTAATRVFGELDEMQKRLTDIAEGNGKVIIGSSYAGHDPDLVQMCMADFMYRYPDVAIDYYEISPLKLIQALDERHIDVAITSIPIRSEDIEWQEVFSEKMGVIMSKDHPLAQEPVLHVAQLRNERFYCNNANTDTRDLTVEFCHRAGFEPNIFFQGLFPELIGRSVSEGKGVSILVKSRFDRDQSMSSKYNWTNNICYRPLAEDYCVRTLGLAYVKQAYHSKAMRLFCQFFIESTRKQHESLEKEARNAAEQLLNE